MGKAKRRRLRRPKRKPTPPRCARQPLPREGARVDTPSFLWKEVPRRGGGWMGIAVSSTQSLPRVGKVASGASRIGFWRYEKDRGQSSQVRRLREHPIHRCAVPLPQWGRQRGGGFTAEKGSQPRLAALGSPFQGKGLAWTLPPSCGRRCPEGAEVGWGKRYEKERGDHIRSTIHESTLCKKTAYKTYL